MNISEYVINTIKEKFGVSEEVQTDNSLIEHGILKSMQLIELLFDLEEEYGIEFDFNSLDVSEVESPAKIEQYIKEMQ